MAARAAVARPPRRLGRVGATTRRVGTTWPYLVPALFFFVGWQLYPIVRVLWISFTDYHFLTGGPTHWIWFRNYTDAFSDPLVRKGLLRALIFTVIFLPGMVFFPMVLAVLVDRVRNHKAASVYRLILLIPAMITGPPIFVLWGWLYSSAIGPINYFLVDVFHIYNIYNQPQWLGSSALVYLSLALMEWWWGLGFHTLFYLAGLATIPKDLYESARVDGAGEWRIFWRITFPRLRPILLARRAPLRHGVRADRRVHHPRRLQPRPADVHLDCLHVGQRIPGRRLEPGLRGGGRPDRNGGDARRRALALLS